MSEPIDDCVCADGLNAIDGIDVNDEINEINICACDCNIALRGIEIIRRNIIEFIGEEKLLVYRKDGLYFLNMIDFYTKERVFTEWLAKTFSEEAITDALWDLQSCKCCNYHQKIRPILFNMARNVKSANKR